jgi:DNA-directed RNA polymerase specialized sigma24 family protein
MQIFKRGAAVEANGVETKDRDEAGRPVAWADLLEAYRTGDRERWSGRIIERLGPWLTAARRQLHAVPPYLDEEDVAQELLVEVLRTASRWRPVCEDRWIPRRLVERAARRVVKSLLAEKLDQVVELGEDLEASESAEPDLVLDTPVGKASVADLRLIYRASVIGESISELAAELGLTPEQMTRRLKSAKERARASAQAGR